MTTIVTKWVDRGSLSFYGNNITGSASTAFGTISNSQNGSRDLNIDSLYSGADIISLSHNTVSGGNLTFSLTGTRANSGWATMSIGGTSFSRTSATYSTSNGNTYWTWSLSATPFGSSNGTDKEIIWDDGGTSVTAPTASSVIITGGTSAQENTTATVNLSNTGSGGTLQYACEVGDTTPDNWQSSNTFTISRGSGTVYARARRSSSTNSNVVSTSQAAFLIGDSSFSRTSPTITSSASSATTTVQYATAGETLAIRVDGESTNLVTAVVASSSSTQNISFSSSLPSAGNSKTYRFFVRRPTSTGGDGSTFNSTGMTFTVTRENIPVPDAPTDLSFSTAATAAASASVTVTASGGGTGTLKVSADGTNWYANGTSFGSRARGTAHTWYARVEGSANSSNYTEAHTPPYLDPDASISAISSPNLDYGSTTHLVAIAGGNASDQYYVYNNAGSVSYGGRTGNGNINITHGVAAGGAATFRVYARKPLNVGGDNAFDNTGTTFEVEVYPNSTSLSVSNNNAAAASVTVTLSATGGQGGTIEYAKTSYSGTTTYAQNRGTTVTYYSRSVAGNGLISSVSSVNHTVGYIAPAGGTPGSPNIFTGGTSHTASISGGTAGTVYEFRSGGYTGTILNTVDGNGTAACSGGAGTYYVTRYKTTATGGSGTTGRTNLATYTVTAISKQTFTIRINYIPGEPGTDPFIQAPTETVDVGSITGSVTSSSGPLEVSVGDDVIWKSGNGQDAVKITSLNDFTNNTDITLTTTTGVTRTLANGVNGTDVIDIEVDAGSDGSATTAYRIKRVGGITSPSGLSSSLSGTESQTETVTLSLSTSGSGGTLEYIQRTTASLLGAPASDWQTSAQFTQPRNTTRYYYASRNRLDGASTSVLTVTVNYLGAVTTGYSFDTASGNIGYGDGAPAISFTAAQANHTVAIFEGSTARSSGVTGATDHNNIATNQIPPAGGSNTYNLRTYRNQDAGGNPSLAYVATNASTITIKRYPQTPSGLTTFTDGGTAAAAGTFTIAVGNLDGASSTTITLSSNYTTNAVANGSAIASVARAGDIIYARNTGSNNLTADAAISTPATYLLPNTPSLPNISNDYNTGTHSIDITSMPTTVYYEVRTESYTGTQRGALTNGGGGTSKSLTVTQINTGGDTVTYYVRGYRLATAGGDEGYDNLGTYTVAETAAPTYTVTAPTSINEGSTGTISVATTNVADNTPLYYQVQGIPFSTSNVGANDFGGTIPSGSFTISSNAGSFTLTPTADSTTEGQETARVTVRTGSISGTIVGTVDINIIDTSLTPSAPTNLSFSTAATASSSTSVTVTASGGGTGTLKVSPDGTNWSTNGTTFSNRTRGTAHTWYARVESTSNSSNYTEPHTPGYLDPNLDVTGTNDSISNTDTSASTTIAGMTASETVAVRINNGTTNLATRVGNGARSFTSSLPTFGNTETYELFISRPTTTGGNAAFVATNRTFTVTRAAANSAPTAFDFTNQSDVAINGAERESANTVTIAGLTTGTSLSVSVSGGTYSKNGAAYSSANTTTVNGDTFKLKHNSSTSYSTSTTTTLTVGTGTGSFVTTTIAQDTTPNAFSFTDKTGNVSTEQNSSVQITGINAATTVSRTSGTATFAVVGTSTTPSAGNFGTSNTTITNNQYLHVKQTTSSSSDTTLSTVMNVGGVTDTWTTTTSSSTYTLTAPTSINEGSSGTFNIATTNVSTGTSLYWSITSPTQFTGSTTGTVTTNSSGAASFSVTPTADSTTEGALTVTARIRTGSQGGTIRASDTFVVNDTSTTPGGSGGGGQSGGSGSNTYGVEIFGPNNSSVVFGSDLRCTSIQVYDTRIYSGNSSHSFTGIADATDSAKVEVVLSSAYGTSTASYGYARTSANGGTVTVSNTQSGARTIETVILRIG